MARGDMVGFFWDDTPPPKILKEKVKRVPPPQTWLEPGYLPGLEEAMACRVEVLSDLELIQLAEQGDTFYYDTECYWNYWLIAFLSEKTGKVFWLEIANDQIMTDRRLRWIMETFTLVSFNGIKYDIPMISVALAELRCGQLKETNDNLIVDEMRPWQVLRKWKAKEIKADHIDLIEVAPLFESLKMYAGRVHIERMQDLPFHHNAILSFEQMMIVRWYCIKDLRSTKKLADSLKAELSLRVDMSKRYGVDLRSKSDAQIAEAVIEHGLRKLGMTHAQMRQPAVEVGKRYRYHVPKFVKFSSPLLQWTVDLIRNAWFVVGEDGAVETPPEMAGLKLPINGGTYTIGIGGLHSTEKKQAIFQDDDYLIVDRDVTSYYPFVILNLGMYPPHLGPGFLKVYRGIVIERVAAKARGDKVTAESLKITVNGSFGKFGSCHSILYSPDLVIQTTVSGQLSLLMLIERLELAGIHVVSANTDGIVSHVPRKLKGVFDAIFTQWEKETNFETEETQYLALCSRDVNSYMAIKKKYDKENKVWLDEPDGAKTKGDYYNPWADKKDMYGRLKKNPKRQICVDAIEAYLGKRTPLATTIRACNDITKFVSIQKVGGGAVKVWKNEGHPDTYEYLGKSVRWYYASGEAGEIVRGNNGYGVGKTQGAKPLMDLPDHMPADVDYDWYVAEAEKLLERLGIAA